MILGSETDHIYLAARRGVYVEIPKVACTSVKVALAPLLGIDLAPTRGNPHAVAYPAPPCPPSASVPLYPGLFTFAFVRNPWDRLVSCYRDKIAGEVEGFTFFEAKRGVANCLARFNVFVAGMSFEAFVDAVASIPDEEADVHFRSQYSFITNQGVIAADFIGRFEQLETDFAAVARRLELNELALPHLQSTPRGRAYATYYTQRTRGIAAQRYAQDIALFGYSFDADQRP